MIEPWRRPIRFRPALISLFFVAVLILHTLFCSAMAQDEDPSEATTAGFPNWKMTTLGGKQFWTDHSWQLGWRIQQHAITGHWRLIDSDNIRHAWGSRSACEQTLAEQGLTQDVPGNRVIILLHGLIRSSSSMTGLQTYLSNTLEQPVVNFEYASTRGSIGAHAAALREVVAGLPNEVRLSFVGHSMGNIVVRHAIGDWQRVADQATLSRIDNVVMLGPPNRGASIARQLSRTKLFGWVTGQGGLELGPQWQEFENHLAIPPCPFGIVAGHLPETNFQNPLIEGASDFVVSVEETRLDGAADFLEVPCLHSFLMDNPQVQRAVANFLRHQTFNEG